MSQWSSAWKTYILFNVYAVFSRVSSGALVFEKMDETSIIEFIMGVIGRFEKMQAAFTSVSREQRDLTIKPRLATLADDDVPPVGTYQPKHEIIDKEQSHAKIISPEGASRGKLFENDG